jgi:hypothetical protein
MHLQAHIFIRVIERAASDTPAVVENTSVRVNKIIGNPIKASATTCATSDHEK